MRPDAFVEALDDERVVAAIREAESRTRAEIRVHVTDRAVADPQEAAVEAFERLGMTRTAERNAILLFVAPDSQSFSILGDRAVHERCGDEFWSAVAEAMREEFRAGRFTEGILAGIAKVGEGLARHFPRHEGDRDRNELPDGVSRD
jgi:uncharacterized membrane protein